MPCWFSLRVFRRRRATRSPGRSVDLLGDAEHLVADDFVGQGEHPMQLLHRLRFRTSLDHYVVALRLALYLVSETALAPVVDVAPFGATRLDQLEPPLDGCPDRLLVQVRVDDD